MKRVRDPEILQLQIEARDRAIEQLRDELCEAREEMLQLVDEPFRTYLQSYPRNDERAQAFAWKAAVVERILDATPPIPPDKVRGQVRAYCPLCKGEAQSLVWGNDGYALPEGLRRHLSGTGNAIPCSVTRAAFRLATDTIKAGS